MASPTVCVSCDIRYCMLFLLSKAQLRENCELNNGLVTLVMIGVTWSPIVVNYEVLSNPEKKRSIKVRKDWSNKSWAVVISIPIRRAACCLVAVLLC